MFFVRKSQDRGYADHGWLQSYHSFSFADYFDRQWMQFGDLRVINEDYVQEGYGFSTHGHKDMEIITYIISGALQHKDSIGNTEVILPGEVQRMSAGTGVLHSEFNPSHEHPTRLLQIWILPERQGIEPGYEQKKFSDQIARGEAVLVASRDGRQGSVMLHQAVDLFAFQSQRSAELHSENLSENSFSRGAIEERSGGVLNGRRAPRQLSNEGSTSFRIGSKDMSLQYPAVWLQMIDGSVEVLVEGEQNVVSLNPGDAFAARNEKLTIKISSAGAHFLLFNLK